MVEVKPGGLHEPPLTNETVESALGPFLNQSNRFHGEPNQKVLEDMLKQGADVNKPGLYRWSPLHYATAEGYAGHVDILLRAKALVNARNDGGHTPLHLAAHAGNIEVVALLLEHAAEVNALNNLGNTPLHWAARADSRVAVATLLEAGADTTISNRHGEMAAHVTRSAETKSLITPLGWEMEQVLWLGARRPKLDTSKEPSSASPSPLIHLGTNLLHRVIASVCPVCYFRSGLELCEEGRGCSSTAPTQR